MTGQLRWADRPTPQQAEEWFRRRVRPAEGAPWANVYAVVAAQVASDLPDEAESDGEEAAAATAAKIIATLRYAVRVGQPITDAEQTRQPASGPLATHEWARAVLLAEMADDDQWVVRFRSEHRPGGLLADDAEAEQWVDQYLSDDGGPKRALRWVGFDGLTRTRLTAPDTPPDALRIVADHLADVYHWHPAVAASFMLFGGVPDCPMLRVSQSVRFAARAASAWDAWVTVEAHPDVPAGLVADAYREAQDDLIGARRPRLLTEPVADAVVVDRTMPGTWQAKQMAHEERMAAKGHSGYRNADDFRRVVRRARAKLLGGSAPGSVGRLLD